MLLVLGATGQVGSHVLAALAEARREGPVRVLVRRPDALAVPPDLSVEVMAGSFDDAAAVASSLEGVSDVIVSTGDNPGQVEREKRIVNLAQATSRPRIIKVSAITASLEPRVSVGIAHGEIEDHLRRSGLPWVILRPTFFYQSLALFGDPVRKAGLLPLPTYRGAVAFADVKDVAAVAARVAQDRSLTERIVTLTGPDAWRLDQVCDELGRRLGRRVRHVNPPSLIFKLMLRTAGGMSWELAGMVDGIAKACAKGDEGIVSHDFEELMGRRPRGLHDYLDEALDLFRE